MKLQVFSGDITGLSTDAIVNAANSSLMGGGGVDGAIHAAAGPELLAACQQLRSTTLPEGLPAGQAVATEGFNLPARWVIHTVGPVYDAADPRPSILAECYRTSLQVATEIGARTVAFPLVSAGVYGWPITDAARIAVRTVAEQRCRPEIAEKIDSVTFVAFNRKAELAYQAALDVISLGLQDSLGGDGYRALRGQQE